ncbi:hypothetical protein [uncultured Nocardioides sp.]|uniref:hypothetical protein n=1 Tax=uncultured Nocardioides sp. TaxID=198441 RepID=UPI0025D60E29|nr:hypothetical protein [uncultured Nocardioides sp.]
MQLRHTSTPGTLVGALLLTAALSSSCGFELGTDRIYTPANGANDRDGEIDVLSAQVVSPEPGTGVFIASLSNNSDEPVELEGVAGSDAQELSAEVTPVEVPAGGLVNLAVSETPVTLTGDFEAGDFLPVEVSFSNGESASMEIPVVINCGYYADVAGVPPGEEECEVPEPAPIEEAE